jgi:hypothetical protein
LFIQRVADERLLASLTWIALPSVTGKRDSLTAVSMLAVSREGAGAGDDGLQDSFLLIFVRGKMAVQNDLSNPPL